MVTFVERVNDDEQFITKSTSEFTAKFTWTIWGNIHSFLLPSVSRTVSPVVSQTIAATPLLLSIKMAYHSPKQALEGRGVSQKKLPFEAYRGIGAVVRSLPQTPHTSKKSFQKRFDAEACRIAPSQSNERRRVQRKWVQPENGIFTESLACTRQNPSCRVRFVQLRSVYRVMLA